MNGQTINLGDYCAFINGGAWKQNEYDVTGYPVVQVSNIKSDTFELAEQKFLRQESFERYKKHQIKSGDLIIATVGSHPSQPSAAGRAAVANEQIDGMLLNQNAVLIRSSSPYLVQDYLCLIGRSPDFRSYVQNAGKGAANQVRISIGAVKAFRFELPSAELQTNVASIINSYDNLIENNRRRIALLEQAARLLYREWFVHFRFPGHETANFVDGLPEGWERTTVDQLLVLQRGFDLPVSNRKDGRIPIYGSTGIVGYHDTPKVSAPVITTGRSGSLGQVSISSVDCWPLNTSLWVKELKGISPLYAYFFLQQFDLKNYGGGASVPTLDRKVVHGQPTVRPSDEVIKNFECFAVPQFEMIQKLQNQSAQLTKARDLLLPRLMDGRIPV